jgi:7-cyano-7-deazaguanine synthase
VLAHYLRARYPHRSLTLLFFKYGQKTCADELRCVKKCASSLKACFISLSLPSLGVLSTSLINRPGKHRKLTSHDLHDLSSEIPVWYVPGRNSIFLTHALAYAESIFIRTKQTFDIAVGFKCEPSESYPDTSALFVKHMQALVPHICSFPCIIQAPFIKKDKEDVVSLGARLHVPFKDTFSCYVGNRSHCGTCLACQLRKAGFYWAHVPDPTSYVVSD